MGRHNFGCTPIRLSIAGALITAWATIVGVVIAQLVAAGLAAERAQVEALQAYLKEIGDLLSNNPDVRGPASADNHDLRTLARAHTLTVLSGLNSTRKELVNDYLREVQLLDVLEPYHPDNSSRRKAKPQRGSSKLTKLTRNHLTQ